MAHMVTLHHSTWYVGQMKESVSDLRIVLIGKNGSENRRVANTILGRAALDSDAPYYLQQSSDRISEEVEEKKITVFNPHLLQTHFPQGVIIEGVRECVSLSAPGPHVFVLVLQNKDFNENDRHRVKYVLNLFSKQAMKHTIVLTTDEETRRSILASRNNTIHGLIKECGGGHLKFNTVSTGWRSEMFRKTEEILKKECKECLICNMFEDEGEETSEDEDQSRSGASVRDDDEEEKDSGLKESTKQQVTEE
ncbi:GTPase IMAP family member 7-like [Onychostoma macrolepis]|uniref:GTPase IMAP family member 7-like n=1 Tax=Onychostoma macrolepis TaxID=369639 RepID=UPI00272A770E|nr:GTPase IMAP family member 7-like [Onychostoma macrolepis]